LPSGGVQATRKPRPNPFTEATRHALKLRASLEAFRSDPDVPIDTNHLERGLRPIPVGGKAWRFCSTEVEAEKVRDHPELGHDVRAARRRSVQVPGRRTSARATHPQRDFADLTPCLWKEETFTGQALPSSTLAS